MLFSGIPLFTRRDSLLMIHGGRSDRQRAQEVAKRYEAAFIEQFNHYLKEEMAETVVPKGEEQRAEPIGPFHADAAAPSEEEQTSHFMKALKAHKELSQEQKEALFLQSKATRAPSPEAASMREATSELRNAPAEESIMAPAKATWGVSQFMDALRAHKERTPEEQRAMSRPSEQPVTTITETRMQEEPGNPALDNYMGSSEEEKTLFEVRYSKRRPAEGTTKAWVEDLPRAMRTFVRFDLRKEGLTERLIEAARQKMNGDIDSYEYRRTVDAHLRIMMDRPRIKMDMLDHDFKTQLFRHALLQLPEMMRGVEQGRGAILRTIAPPDQVPQR